jgi:uncharacterized membrane protein YbhN (UPF0104 family)
MPTTTMIVTVSGKPGLPQRGKARFPGHRDDHERSGWRGRVWPWVRVLGGLAILAVLVWRLGTGGFLAGLRVIDAGTLLAATGIGLLTTVLSAWRWCLVTRGLGGSLALPTATADYYRALFLNAALPGGILGDVHRAVRYGRDAGDVGLGVRAVALERFAGQLVVVAVAVAVLPAAPVPLIPQVWPAWPAAGTVPGAAAVVAVSGVAGAALVAHRAGRAVRAAAGTLRRGLLARRVWPGVLLSSVAVLAGYLATFLLAARAAGVTAPAGQLLPLLLLALLAMAVPLNVGGWGPREGACAWAFGAAGLGATQGLTVAVVYGLSVFVASLPGAGVLVVRWFQARPAAGQAEPGPGSDGSYRSDSA